jgi:hypothetical protein
VATVKASLETEKTAHTATKAELATAKARPAVITASGDPAQPGKKPSEGSAKTEADLKAEYAASKDLQAEYGSVDVYVHAKLREQDGAQA